MAVRHGTKYRKLKKKNLYLQCHGGRSSQGIISRYSKKSSSMYLALDEVAEFIGCYPQLAVTQLCLSQQGKFLLTTVAKRREQLCKTGDDKGGDDLVIAKLQTRRSGCKYCSQWQTLGLSKYQGWFHTCTPAMATQSETNCNIFIIILYYKHD